MDRNIFITEISRKIILHQKVNAHKISIRFCPDCKNDETEIVRAGEKLKESKKRAKMICKNSTSNRDWGKGYACAGRTKQCTIVPSDHYGPIPGVEVGSQWLYRIQVGANASLVTFQHLKNVPVLDCLQNRHS